MFGPEYPKINGIWKRDEHGTVLLGDWSVPEFDFLSDKPWIWTEKIDGTNLRLHWNGKDVTLGGRTDKAQLQASLVKALAPQLDPALWASIFPDSDDVTVYGEGYGAGIQKGGGNYRPDQAMIVFDVKVGPWWLVPDAVYDVSERLGLDMVPDCGIFTPSEAWAQVQDPALCSYWRGVQIEGFVGRPLVDLFDRRGHRITMKVKVKDWQDYERRAHA